MIRRAFLRTSSSGTVICVKGKVSAYSALFLVCCMVSLFSVTACVGWNLKENGAASVFSENEQIENPSVSLPAQPSVDETGLTVISDTQWVQNLLLIGTDAATDSEACRSDAMILISLNHQTKRMVACSLLRDMLVDVDGYGKTRLNSAYSFGGAPLLLKTLRKELNLDISHYVTVNFSSFSELIDRLGGVELSVTAQEAKVLNELAVEIGADVSQIPLKDGTYHLNGAQTLAYARNRSSAMGDFDRTARQRKILDCLFQKMKQASVFELMNLAPMILNNISTNIPLTQWNTYLSVLPQCLDYEKIYTSIPQEETYALITYRGMAVIDVDFEANVRYLSKEIYTE